MSSTVRLTELLCAVVTREVAAGNAEPYDAVKAALATAVAVAQMFAANAPTDEQVDEFVDDMTDAVERNVTSWKGGAT